MVCPSCGSEYRPGIIECADCHVPLVVPQPDLGEGDQAVYGLAEWEPDRRTLLGRALDGAGIPYLWEGDGDLVVREEHAEAVEEILDDVENVEELEEDEAAGDEVPYETLAELFDLADRVTRDPEDPDLCDEFLDVCRSVEASVPPYGFEAQTWAKIKGLTAFLRRELDTGEDNDTVADGARRLREALRPYI
jgi:hypothetical protein